MVKLALVLIPALLLVPAIGHAQATSPAEAAPVTSMRRDGVRLRGLIGGWAGGGVGDGGSYRDGGYGFGLGPTAQLGVQFNNVVGVAAYATGAFWLLSVWGSTGILVDFTPVEWFTVGAGFGVTGMSTYGGFFNRSHDWAGVAVPLEIGFNIPYGRGDDGIVRRALRIGLDANVGVLPGAALSGGLSIGYLVY